MEASNVNYLEGRRLVKRWGGPIPAIVSLVLTLAVFYGTWWVFQDPRGMLRMYTPYVGYMYTRWWLIVLIWMVYLFNFWPFSRNWLERMSHAKCVKRPSRCVFSIRDSGNLNGGFGLAHCF